MWTVSQSRGRRPSKHPLLNDQAWLREQYIDNRLTLEEVARLAQVPGANRTTVRRALIRQGIAVRSVSDGKMGRSHEGVPRSPETRAKIAEKHRGKTLSAEHRDKIRATSLGRRHSDATRSALAEMRRGEANPMFGTVAPNRGPDYTPDLAEARRRRSRKHRLGLTHAEYEELLAEQDGKCAICGKPESKVLNGRVTHLAVDHCHRTLQRRGLLCHRCNVLLGLAHEAPEVLQSAIDYLKRHATETP